MDNAHRVKNEKGLFVELSFMAFVTIAVAEALRREVLPLVEASRQKRCAEALDLLDQMPLANGHTWTTRFDPHFDQAAEDKYQQYQRDKARNNWTSRPGAISPARGWHAPGAAKSSSNGAQVQVGSAKAAGWLDIAPMAAAMGEINHLLSLARLDPVEERYWRGSKTAAKRAAELTFEPVRAFDELATSEAWMLYVGGASRGGFIDDKGSPGPLSRARMFESAQAAARTAGSRRISHWKVARASVLLVALESFPGDSVDDKLSAAIALREAEALRQALRGATLEELQTRMAELQGELVQARGVQDPAASASDASAPKRRGSRL